MLAALDIILPQMLIEDALGTKKTHMSKLIQPHNQLVQKHSLGLSTQSQIAHPLTLDCDVSCLSPIDQTLQDIF